MSWVAALGLVVLVIWLVLVFDWHGFWRFDRVLAAPSAPPPGGRWPEVCVIVPARNEEQTLEAALSSLLAQDYPGEMRIWLVDDNSEDATGEIARRLARGDSRLSVLEAPEKPAGWAGKVAALEHGTRQALKAGRPEFLFFTDADIAHAPEALRALVAKAQGERRGLVSALVRLPCESFWERLLIPAFVYFFFLLYPPRAVERPDAYAAGAAGGCLLIRAAALADIGSWAAIHDAIIDDCSLARKVKDRGFRLWLGLTPLSRSLRGYPRLADVWRMVARSAYAQLHHSPLLLALSLAGMGLVFLVPALYVPGFLFGGAGRHFLGLAAFGLMTASYLPALRWFGLRRGWALSLPLAAALYMAMTVSSALSHASGRGVRWRGRKVR